MTTTPMAIANPGLVRKNALMVFHANAEATECITVVAGPVEWWWLAWWTARRLWAIAVLVRAVVVIDQTIAPGTHVYDRGCGSIRAVARRRG